MLEVQLAGAKGAIGLQERLAALNKAVFGFEEAGEKDSKAERSDFAVPPANACVITAMQLKFAGASFKLKRAQAPKRLEISLLQICEMGHLTDSFPKK